ncbi:MAG: redoxin domain-containing protein, partial [Chloroflexota bacterium]|nr:redoxin domain-containing protein [Chloroflexota bacterium]
MPRPAAILMFLGLAVAMLAFLIACTSESEDSTTDPAPPAAAEVAPKPEPTPTAVPTPSLSLPITEDTLTAPRIQGEGINEWINSEELILAELQAENKVVLIDFWTYTCINCIRTLPYLKQWHDKYADRGLVIIGVHTPEFEFEKSLDNVKEAVEGFEIKYPVVQDNNYWTWNVFNNRYWPAKYLIDKDGYVRYSHFGEGKYDETEQAIRLLLEEADQAVADISDDENPVRMVAPNALSSRSPDGLTRELYAGTHRNYSALRSGIRAPYVLNEEYYKRANTDTEYTDPGDWQNHHIYLQGLWHNGEESLRHARMTEDFEDYMALSFNAVDVNVV